ncbi:MAG TPA: hypothetical protein DDW84_08770 [Phycisphaerales bacterium]|nr:MAG: hypothetical protein A2Y13_09555 [Planctomycetes bacterium GWC2_45_44]HBG78911.1 hypothetical protein [Phycisphaerales bacterium]HBR18857.1 hypothetical protein [Phycisphaerales bacterium]
MTSASSVEPWNPGFVGIVVLREGKPVDKKRHISSVKSPDYYLYLIENSQDALFSINPQTGQFEYVSPAVKAIIGFTPEEVIKMGAEGMNRRVSPQYQRIMDKFAADSKKKKLPKHYVSYVETRFKHKKALCLAGYQ